MPDETGDRIEYGRTPYEKAVDDRQLARTIAALRALVEEKDEALRAALLVETEHDGHVNPDDRCWCQDACKALALTEAMMLERLEEK